MSTISDRYPGGIVETLNGNNYVLKKDLDIIPINYGSLPLMKYEEKWHIIMYRKHPENFARYERKGIFLFRPPSIRIDK